MNNNSDNNAKKSKKLKQSPPPEATATPETTMPEIPLAPSSSATASSSGPAPGTPPPETAAMPEIPVPPSATPSASGTPSPSVPAPSAGSPVAPAAASGPALVTTSKSPATAVSLDAQIWVASRATSLGTAVTLLSKPTDLVIVSANLRYPMRIAAIKSAHPTRSPNGTPAVGILLQITDTEFKMYRLDLEKLALAATMHDADMVTELIVRGAIAQYRYGNMVLGSEYLYASLPHYATATPAVPVVPAAVPGVPAAPSVPATPAASTVLAGPGSPAAPMASAPVIKPPEPTIITITNDAAIDKMREEYRLARRNLHFVYLSIIGALVGFIIGVFLSEMMPPPAPQAEHGVAYPR